MVSLDDSVFVIGGWNGDNSYDSTIAKYHGGEWTKFGDLAKGRFGHGAILSGNEMMVLGGYTANK